MSLRRRGWVLALAVLAVAGAGGVVALVLVGAVDLPEERSFSIDAIEVEADLDPDGVLHVREEVTYTFRGADDEPYTVGTRDFEVGPRSGTITSIAAYRDGEELTTLVSNPGLFEWDISPATSGTYTYELRYEVEDAVDVGSDVVQLWRQWIGSTSPAIGRWSAEIRLPEGAGEVRGWAHGPLTGTVEVDDDVVRAQVDDVPAGRFVETRTAVPVGRFTLPPGSTALLPRILEEERAWAEQANAERERFAREEADRLEAERRRDEVGDVLDVLAWPLAALAFIGFWAIWRRWGRDPERPSDVGDYWREVPDDPPAVAAAFLGWRSVSSDAYAATILDLARRGHLTIEEVPQERFLRKDGVQHRFTKVDPAPEPHVRRFERRALDWLFKDGPTTTKEELVARSRAQQTSATKFWRGFKKEVLAELDRRDYVVRGKAVPIGLHLLVTAAMAGVLVLAVVTQAWIATVVAGTSVLALLPLTFLHLSRTEAGARRYAEWTALRSYLKDFSRLDEAPVGHLALWEHYLVAAVALGVAEDLIRGLEVHFPDLVENQARTGFAPWYVAVPGHHGGLGEVGSFGSDFGGAAVSSFTPASSGSGGGGGFSGGGGGGGGGGGFGAR